MKVSKRSWHYRWWRWWHSASLKKPKNLCQYFWFLVLTGLFSLFTSILILGFIFIFIIWIIQNILLVLKVLGGVTLLSFLIFVYIKVVDWVGKHFPLPFNPSPKSLKEPGPVRAYLRAKKEKVCPLIEIVD